MGMSRDVSVDKRSTVEVSVKISSLDEGRGVLESLKFGVNELCTILDITSIEELKNLSIGVGRVSVVVENVFTVVEVGEIATEVKSASVDNASTKVDVMAGEEAENASIEMKMASVNASTEVEMKAGAGDGVKILTERVGSYDDIGTSLLFKDVCKMVLENKLSDVSIVEIIMLEEEDA